MAVQLPNCALAVRPRAEVLDEHGFPMPGEAAALRGPWPGRKAEDAAGRWSLALDPAAWPIDEHTIVVEPATGAEWTVLTADLLTHNVVSIVDYVKVTAHLRVGADRAHTKP